MGRRPTTNSLYEQDNTDTEKIRTYRHPCSEWDSKTRKHSVRLGPRGYCNRQSTTYELILKNLIIGRQ
jgi:hypothetical protein